MIGAVLSAGLHAPAANSLPLASITVGTLRSAGPQLLSAPMQLTWRYAPSRVCLRWLACAHHHDWHAEPFACWFPAKTTELFTWAPCTASGAARSNATAPAAAIIANLCRLQVGVARSAVRARVVAAAPSLRSRALSREVPRTPCVACRRAPNGHEMPPHRFTTLWDRVFSNIMQPRPVRRYHT